MKKAEHTDQYCGIYVCYCNANKINTYISLLESIAQLARPVLNREQFHGPLDVCSNYYGTCHCNEVLLDEKLEELKEIK